MKSIFEELPSSRYEETCTAILKYLIENNKKIRKAFLKFLSQNSIKNSISANHFKCIKELVIAGSKKGPTGRIDLFLETDEFNIGIECKFGAGFGDSQIETYLKALYEFSNGDKKTKSPLSIERSAKRIPIFFLLIPKYRKRKILEEIRDKKVEIPNKSGKMVKQNIKEMIHFITWEDLDEMLSKKDLKDSFDEKSFVLLDHFLAFLDLSISLPEELANKIKKIENLPASKTLIDTHINLVVRTWPSFENLINGGRLAPGHYLYGSLLKTKDGKPYGWYGMLSVDYFSIQAVRAKTIFAMVFDDKTRKYLKENFKDIEKYGLKWINAKDVWGWLNTGDFIPEILYFNLIGKNPNFEKMDTWHAVGDKLFEILSKFIDF